MKRTRTALPAFAIALACASEMAFAGSQALATGQCPARVQIGFGQSSADIARRCGVTPEALDRQNPGLGLDDRKSQLGVTVSVPRPALPSPAIGVTRNGFVPVPTPPGALGR